MYQPDDWSAVEVNVEPAWHHGEILAQEPSTGPEAHKHADL